MQEQSQNPREKVSFRVEGMHCGGCVKKVIKALSAVPGVHVDTVEIGHVEVSVAEDAGKQEISRDTLRVAIERMGYRVIPEAA